MTAVDAVVFVVDDDRETADWLASLLGRVGLGVAWFGSPEVFLNAYKPSCPACLVMDIRFPGMSGLDLLARLRERGLRLPAIVLSANSDVAMAVRAMQCGATDFLDKSHFEPQRFIDSVLAAIARDSEYAERRHAGLAFNRRLAALTPREREVMDLLIDGKTNKMIAFDLGLSPKTVETHRTKVFQKMQVRSLVELTRTVLSQQLADRRDLN